MKVLQYLVEAIDLSVYSYIKPAAIHRYSLQDQDLHKYVKTLSVALNYYLQAYSLGESIAKGGLGVSSANLGKLISQTIAASFSKLSAKTVVELHLMLIPTVMSISYVLSVERTMNLNTFRKASALMLTHSDVKDALEVYAVLKKFDKYERILAEVGISEGIIRTNSMNLRTLYLALGKRVSLLNTLVDRLEVIIGMSNRFIKTYDETYDYNIATVSSYIYGLESLYGISLKPDILKERNFMNELYRLDKELRSKGYNFNDLIPVLTASTLLSLFTLEHSVRS
ncbi:MAG: hypothetical protein RMH77_06290 [Sulfolobales archaeon]|nr:hypothetical protein [Sulfolobales archaeon]MCX8185528.1 hypothetical protein [Sulfolobales archaeon]MDW7969993.1 hypothetical protein [Sulfolobales archaeon]